MIQLLFAFLLCFRSSLGISPVGPVAVCMQGELLGRVANFTLSSVAEKFIRPVSEEVPRMDIFYSVPEKDLTKPESRNLIKKFGNMLRNQNPRRNIHFQLITQDESMPIEDQLESEGFDLELPLNHELLLPPGQAFCGSRLWTYRMLDLCKKHILLSEAKRKIKYEYVIRTRPDYFWLCEHFPLTKLKQIQDSTSDSSKIWIPDGEDYGGVTDRHAVVSRSVFEFYFSQWGILTGNLAHEVMKPIIDAKKQNRAVPLIGVEMFLIYTLFYHAKKPGVELSIDRIPSCAYTFCSGIRSGLSAEPQKAGKRNMFSTCSQESSTWQNNYICLQENVQEDWKYVKYKIEFNKTRQTTECLQKHFEEYEKQKFIDTARKINPRVDEDYSLNLFNQIKSLSFFDSSSDIHYLGRNASGLSSLITKTVSMLRNMAPSPYTSPRSPSSHLWSLSFPPSWTYPLSELDCFCPLRIHNSLYFGISKPIHSICKSYKKEAGKRDHGQGG